MTRNAPLALAQSLGDTALLSSTFFGPVQWYQKLHRHARCVVESCDSFVKQTYRNRCVIATANGPQALTVPVERPDGDSRAAMRDIRVSDHGNWRHVHWHALMSAYGDSPFFDYYADDLRPFFERRWTFLLDYNMEATLKMCELLDITPHIDMSESYVDAPAEGFVDYREAIRPKHPLPDEAFTPPVYYQVHALRRGFQPNMSVLDLLFNEGSEGIFYL